MRWWLLSLLWTVAVTGLRAAPIDRKEEVTIGGIRQWIETKGTDDSHPLMLFLHGGPGNSVIRYADKFTGELQKQFICVQWDQRGAGRTKALNPSLGPPKLREMIADAEELIRFLLDRHNRKKLYLMGHSWGGFLALRFAAVHAELLEACLVINPMVNQNASEQRSLRWMMQEAGTEHPEAMAELQGIHIPFRSFRDLYLHRKWLALMQKKKAPSLSFVEKWSKTNLPLFLEASAVDLSQQVFRVDCRLYFFLGGMDRQTDCGLSTTYFRMVKAEKKDLFLFPQSAHNLHLTEPMEFQAKVARLLETP